MPTGVQQSPIVQADTFNDQGVTLPAPNGISHETRRRIFGETAAVEENLPISQIVIQDDHQFWCLNELGNSGYVISRTRRQETGWIILRVLRQMPLILGRGSRLDIDGIEILRHVDHVAARGHLPHSG